MELPFLQNMVVKMWSLSKREAHRSAYKTNLRAS